MERMPWWVGWLLLGVLSPVVALADPLRIGILGSPGAFTDGFESAIVEDAPDWQLVSDSRQADVMVAIGDNAFIQSLTLGRPVLGIYVSRQLVALQSPQSCRCTAVWAGVSLRAQLRVVQAMMPLARRLGVVVGPNSAWNLSEISAGSDGLQLHPLSADNLTALGEQLRDHLPDLDAVLLPVDDLLLDSGAAKLVLLTSYRMRRPVFGPDLAFVNAGSAASAYASGGDLVRAARQQLDNWSRQKRWLSPGFVGTATVAVNDHVAGSFDLRYRDSQSLGKALGEKP
ncbi:MAG: hypothetical protein R3292_08275 [Alcanivorax sp.]|nr:hypothetical protein [Alcanivorax sp.]